ncbi:hypothetical protein EXIGLDRAFT_754131 [Exidia glandulosa HHB12029]|uniref:Uncharacterized protein n=1 Tax=Exidia glandulosa HHB12029 TaxID=1314781 RepID=A0A165D752_EXIGL|nr:hypothetical protein EXIGLDRAFT_754131 [Exidia glandulosa HHB12029]
MNTGSRNNGANADAQGHGSGPDGQMTGDWAYLQHAMDPNYSGLGRGDFYGSSGSVFTIEQQDQRYQQAARQAQAFLSQRGVQSYQGNRQQQQNPNLNRTATQTRQL